MRKIIILFLTFILAACSAAPTQAPLPSPVPPTAQIVIATVLVPVEVTSAATPVPPTAQVVVATVLVPVEVTSGAAPTVDQAAVPTIGAPVSSGPIALDPKYNGQSFERLSISGDKFSLNCQPKEISLDAYSTDIYIVRTDLYFRMRDKHSADIPEWTIAGTMQTDGGNHFWMTLKGDQIKADLRKHQGWFDFEFVGLNKLGDAVGRSEKITGLVSYTIDCQ